MTGAQTLKVIARAVFGLQLDKAKSRIAQLEAEKRKPLSAATVLKSRVDHETRMKAASADLSVRLDKATPCDKLFLRCQRRRYLVVGLRPLLLLPWEAGEMKGNLAIFGVTTPRRRPNYSLVNLFGQHLFEIDITPAAEEAQSSLLWYAEMSSVIPQFFKIDFSTSNVE
jgi:hypothetical protein